MVEPSPSTWITTDADGGAIALRAVVFLVILLASLVAAVVVRDLLRRAGKATSRAMTRETDGGPWACVRCRSVTPAGRERCDGCGADRGASELRVPAPEPEPDILPVAIEAGPASRLSLEHNAGAHADGLSGHWRLRLNGVIVGSAARRDGALAMLNAVSGAEHVIFDPHDTGAAPYPLDAVIRAFEGPRLPITVPCPEHGAAGGGR